MKKNIIYFLSIFIFIILFAQTNIAFAAFEVKDYPTLPFVQTPTADSDLGSYVSYWFAFVIYIAGAAAAISFAVGAVGFIVSGENPETASSAKDRMKGAIVGLILVFSSFVLLKTINPAFENLVIAEPPPPPEIPEIPRSGVYFYLTSDCSGDKIGPFTSSQDALDEEFAGEIKSVKLVNNPLAGISFVTILHNTEGLNNGGGCSEPIIGSDSQTSSGSPDQCVPVDIPTYAADIYMFKKWPNFLLSSTDGVTFYSEPFGITRGSTAGFYSVSDETIRKTPSFKMSANEMCFNYQFINVKTAYKRRCDSNKCGYKSLICKNHSDCAGDEICSDGICKSPLFLGESRCSNKGCTTFQDCPRSAEIKGDYLLGLYSTMYCLDDNDCYEGDSCEDFVCMSGNKEAKYCQTFTSSSLGIFNFNTQPIIAAGGQVIDDVYIIPVER